MDGDQTPRERSTRRAWILRAAMLVVAVAVVLAIPRLVGEVDWPAVGAAFGELTWWQLLVLAVVVVGRQVAKALPKAFCIRGLSPLRALITDLGSVLMLAVTPPPGYMALRLAMFGSWGISLTRTMAGSMLTTAIFQLVRFSVPLLGFVLLFASGAAVSYRWLEAFFVVGALVAGVLLVQILRSDALARSIGLAGGRIAHRWRSSIDPQQWARACVGFRADVAEPFRAGFGWSLVSLWVMLLLDYAALVLCLRFVGVTADEVGLAEIAIAYAFAYPFTFLPWEGLGVVDTILLAGLVASSGHAVEAPAVAAIVVWRTFTLVQPILMGLVAVAAWRRTVPDLETG